MSGSCSVNDCVGPVIVRGMCPKHYTRWRRHGDPSAVQRRGTKPTPLVERIANKFLVGDGCWPWTGCADELGYGQIKADGPGNQKKQAHRAVYELISGPIPDGLHLDHLCNNPNCVRPGHLEPVTQAENNRRAAERRSTERFDRWTLRAHQ